MAPSRSLRLSSRAIRAGQGRAGQAQLADGCTSCVLARSLARSTISLPPHHAPRSGPHAAQPASVTVVSAGLGPLAPYLRDDGCLAVAPPTSSGRPSSSLRRQASTYGKPVQTGGSRSLAPSSLALWSGRSPRGCSWDAVQQANKREREAGSRRTDGRAKPGARWSVRAGMDVDIADISASPSRGPIV
ncbi:uncharacterized protein PSFLO_04652 [Pseudozyma flocculosa]|uniref:Uncharacterized protein n=1 Tax=Pseudozyma flocculosa TaxID=84751 RepID=A0A5C3F3U2_9BASI|nr:uncharacterized protein PSFLO_04652 [Pseudozyma flocculosa]